MRGSCATGRLRSKITCCRPPAASWPEAAAKARYVLKLYAEGLPPEDARHRDLIAAILEDFARLTEQE
jgi:hypothetical protein